MWHPIGLRGAAGLTPPELAEKLARLRDATVRAGRPADAVGVAFRAPLDLWPRGRKPAGGGPTAATPLCGPAAKVIDDIRAYQAIGVRTFVFDSPVSDPKVMVETMRRFAREVRPKVARLPRRGGGAAP